MIRSGRKGVRKTCQSSLPLEGQEHFRGLWSFSPEREVLALLQGGCSYSSLGELCTPPSLGWCAPEGRSRAPWWDACLRGGRVARLAEGLLPLRCSLR